MSDEKNGTLNLPGSGYDVVAKILHAYALCGEKPASLSDVAGRAGLDKTIVSRNNGFLMSLGLLAGGKSKVLTVPGRELAIAVGHDLQEDISLAWQRAVLTAPAAQPVLDIIRIQRAVPAEALPAKIAAALGIPDSPATKTGTNTLMEVLKRAALISETDGKISLSASVNAGGSTKPPQASTPPQLPAAELPSASATRLPSGAVETPAAATSSASEEAQTFRSSKAVQAGIPVHVNIELHLPASAEQAVYDALFKSIREHLLVQ